MTQSHQLTYNETINKIQIINNSIINPLVDNDYLNETERVELCEKFLDEYLFDDGQHQNFPEFNCDQLIKFSKNLSKKPKPLLFLRILKCENLKSKDANGLSDPYLKISLQNTDEINSSGNSNSYEPQTSEIHFGTLNPIFDEVFVFPFDTENFNKIKIELFDSDTHGKDTNKNLNKNEDKKMKFNLKNLMKDTFSSTDDFLGQVFLKLSEFTTILQEVDGQNLMNKNGKRGSNGKIFYQFQVVSDYVPDPTGYDIFEIFEFLVQRIIGFEQGYDESLDQCQYSIGMVICVVRYSDSSKATYFHSNLLSTHSSNPFPCDTTPCYQNQAST
jgi:hypothetical protein